MPKQLACDPETISLFLNDELSPQQQAEFTALLESCPECQGAVDAAAAEKSFWDEAVSHLGFSTHPTNRKSTTAKQVELSDGEFRDEFEQPFKHSTSSLLSSLAPTDDPEMLGRIGEYEISGIVGIGGMGAVLKGFDKSLMRVVAIKVMAPHLADKGSARKRFEREARAAAAISHDNVCDIYRVDELNGLPYLVMPFARGPSLQKRIDDDGPLSTIDVVLVGKQIAAGLAAAHEQGLVHRDIKPANILLNDGVERILITDFGVARAMDDAAMTQSGLIAGTPQYMSPEQARGEVVDQRSDLFSLGSVLYTACTGRPPFRGETPFGILRKISESEPRSILGVNPEIPSWLVGIIDRLLEKDPSRRFEDAKEVSELMERCLAHLRQPNRIALPQIVVDLPTKTMASPPRKPKPELKKRSFKWAGIAVSLLGLVALGLIGFFQFTQAPDISGNWQGESWKSIKLQSVEEADDWYVGKFIDAEGNDGAIHLEWSRLERRFKGRWSVDANTSGMIVLRQGTSNSVRGAIMLDSESNAEPTTDRLRDFIWQPSSKTSQGQLTSQVEPDQPIPGMRIVTSPVRGNVVEIGPGLKRGGRVNQGDLIVAIVPIEISQYRNALKTRFDSLKTKLNTKLANTNEYEKKVVDFEKAMKQASRLIADRTQTFKAEYDEKSELVKGLIAREKQARLEFERTRQLVEEGIVSEQKLKSRQQEWDMTKGALRSAEAALESARSDWENGKQSLENEQLLARNRVDQAKATLASNLNEIATIKKQIAPLQSKLDQSLVKIVALENGRLERIDIDAIGHFVREGQQLVVVRTAARGSLEMVDVGPPNPAVTWEPSRRKIPLFAPSKGVVSHVADGICSGRKVKKGEFLLSIRTSREHVSGIKASLRDAKLQLDASRNELTLVEKTLANLGKAQDLAIQTSEERAKAAATLVQAKTDVISGLKEIAAIKEKDVQRTGALVDKKVKPQKELDAAKQAWRTAQLQLESSINDLKTLEHDLKIKTLEIAQAKNEAENKLNQAEHERSQAKARVVQLEQSVAELENELDEVTELKVIAPIDGTITRLVIDPASTPVLKGGDLIMEIVTSPKSKKSK